MTQWKDLTPEEQDVLERINSGENVELNPCTQWMMWRFIDIEMDGSGNLRLDQDGKALLASKGTPYHAHE